MEALKFIAGILLVVILACFTIFMIALAVFIIQQAISEWRWEHRRK